eukprot:750480-Hanusia_phi.AAC.17
MGVDVMKQLGPASQAAVAQQIQTKHLRADSQEFASIACIPPARGKAPQADCGITSRQRRRLEARVVEPSDRCSAAQHVNASRGLSASPVAAESQSLAALAVPKRETEEVHQLVRIRMMRQA